jgi:acid phosphatase type 7
MANQKSGSVGLCLTLFAALCSVTGGAHAIGIAKGPYLMHPTTSTITVCWISDTETTGTVTYAVEPADPSASWKPATESAKTHFHRVRIAGLRPYARYAYRVTCDGQTSAPASFLTAAPPGRSFKFVAYGDTRTQPEKHRAVVDRIVAFRPDFVLQTGDQVANGEDEEQWAVFFTTASKMLKDTAYFPELGNHEREAAAYFRYFDLPKDYSFDYGDAHFVGLDSNRPEAERAAQDTWLRQDLAAHLDARWRIVFFHHTPYTCVDKEGRRREAERLRARLEPIFLAGKVQLVINGHDHTYQHHLGTGGIHYVVTGGGGAPLYDVRVDTPFTKAAKKAYHDCEITVTDTTLTVRAVEPDGTEIEQFRLRAVGS